MLNRSYGVTQIPWLKRLAGRKNSFLLFPSSFSTASQHLHPRSAKCTPRNTIKTSVICPKAIDRRDMGEEQQRFYYVGSCCSGKLTLISVPFSKENSPYLGALGMGATQSYAIFLNRLQKIWVKPGHNLKMFWFLRLLLGIYCFVHVPFIFFIIAPYS